jgi:hypothetical protein
VFTILSACSEAERATPPVPGADTAPKIPAPRDRSINDAARFLAGLPGEPGSAYAALEREEDWKNYAAQFEKAFTRADDRLLRPVREFSARELNKEADGGFVFYPFSGPDILYAQAFYPDAKRYVLCGLERPGSILAASDYKPETLAQQLDGVRQGSASLLHRSFFITDEMSRQFRGQLMDGLLPVVLMLMARSGNTIDSMRFLTMDADGKVVEIPKAEEKRGERPDGFEISFRRAGEADLRTVTYFRLDMGYALRINPTFSRYLAAQEKPRVLLKSASFLLHSPNFSVIRNYILDNARTVVQDDSGVPYRFYRERNWTVNLYGGYRRPDNPFTKMLQPDLAEAYAQPDRVREKGFSMGYGTGRRPTALLIARPPAGS